MHASFVALLATLACSSDPRASAQPYTAPPPPPAAPATPTAQPAPLFRRSVQLTIFGSFPEPALAQIEAQLRTQLDVEVLPARQRELPASAYYAPRKRYRAERLLDALDAQPHRGFGQLGLTEVDISTTKGKHKDWGVFGLAWIGGDSAVLSTHRLLRDQPSEELYRFRVVTTAVHEIGHMLGLDHCTEPRCLMNDAEGSIKTVDDSSGELGPRCKAALVRLAPKRQLPLREREAAAR